MRVEKMGNLAADQRKEKANNLDYKLEGACIPWERSRDKLGYGIVGIKNVKFLAHRVSYILNVGNIPMNRFVCHKCDNPACVNPNHLFLGTHSDNMKDGVKKGRFKIFPRHGENNPNSKLNNKEVLEIRKLNYEGYPVSKLSKKFNVSYSCIYRIILKAAWKKDKN